jgi:hypothetical protein
MNIISIIKSIVSKLIVLLIILFLIFFSFPCGDEIKRIKIKGNNEIEFISKIKDCGATTGTVQELYIVNKNDDISMLQDPILKLENGNIDIFQKYNYIYIITNSKKIHHFQNYISKDKRYYIILNNTI